jgi:hypothetical protein
LLEAISDELFTKSRSNLAPHRVAGHMRQILEFYECFLERLEHGHIDYDARRPDQTIERSRTSTLTRLRCIVERLEPAATDVPVAVRMEDARASGKADCLLVSTAGRQP